MADGYSYELAGKKFREAVKSINNNSSSGDLKFRVLTSQEADSLAKTLRPVYGHHRKDSKAQISGYKKDSPLARLVHGEDIRITIHPKLSQDAKTVKTVEVRHKEIKKLQKKVKLYYNGQEINQDTPPEICKGVYHFYSIKYGNKIPKQEIPKKYRGTGGFTQYKNHLEEKNYSLVCRFESITYFNNRNELLTEPRRVVRYDTYFPKLAHQGEKTDYQHHGLREFTKGKELTKLREIKDVNALKREYRDKFDGMLLVASQHNEIYSTTLPGAFVQSLSELEKLKAKKAYVEALVESVEAIHKNLQKNGNSSKYRGFAGAMVCCAGIKELNDIVEDAKRKTEGLLIFNNPLCAGAVDELSDGETITAQPVMGEPFKPVGNGALGPRATKAKDERDSRYSLPVHTAVANPHYNPWLTRLLEIIAAWGGINTASPSTGQPEFSVGNFCRNLVSP